MGKEAAVKGKSFADLTPHLFLCFGDFASLDRMQNVPD